MDQSKSIPGRRSRLYHQIASESRSDQFQNRVQETCRLRRSSGQTVRIGCRKGVLGHSGIPEVTRGAGHMAGMAVAQAGCGAPVDFRVRVESDRHLMQRQLGGIESVAAARIRRSLNRSRASGGIASIVSSFPRTMRSLPRRRRWIAPGPPPCNGSRLHPGLTVTERSARPNERPRGREGEAADRIAPPRENPLALGAT